MRKTYKFEDLVRVWKAAELNAKITGKAWDNELSPTDYCRSYQRGRGFITLETFGKWKLLFKAMLPGLTQKNMKQILRDLREREKEFDRRGKERYFKEEDGEHKDRWSYGRNWLAGVTKHSLIKGRLYPLDRYKYRLVLNKWINRIIDNGTLRDMTEQLTSKIMEDVDAHGYIKVVGSSRSYEKNITSSIRDGLVKKIVGTQWVSYHPSRIASEMELRGNSHIVDTTWVAPYKTKEGRAGLMLCIKLPQSSGDYCFVEDLEKYVGPNQRTWLYNSMLILDKKNTVVLSHPEVIEDLEDFLHSERGGEASD